MVISIIRKISRAKPAAFTALKNLTGIFLLVIDSMPTKSSLPPSRAGNGRRLIIERFIERIDKLEEKLSA